MCGYLEFQDVGKCVLDKGLKSGVRFCVSGLAAERIIYAFTVGGRVRYAGVCNSTSTTLKHRMKRYQGMAGAGTNKRITEAIKECLLKGQPVTIRAWKPDTEVQFGTQFGTFKIDLVRGLENPLLDRLAPEWNINT